MICVDASVAAKWIFDEEHFQAARALYRDAADRAERIVAPLLLPIEMTNIIRQRMRRAKPPQQHPLTLPEATDALERFLAFPLALTMPPELHRQALELAAAHDLPAVYDTHYLAMAQMLGCPLWTADQNLIHTLGGTLPFVKWIGDYQQ